MSGTTTCPEKETPCNDGSGECYYTPAKCKDSRWCSHASINQTAVCLGKPNKLFQWVQNTLKSLLCLQTAECLKHILWMKRNQASQWSKKVFVKLLYIQLNYSWMVEISSVSLILSTGQTNCYIWTNKKNHDITP